MKVRDSGMPECEMLNLAVVTAHFRPRPEQCIKWAKQAGFADPKQFDLKPYHYGIVMVKKGGGK